MFYRTPTYITYFCIHTRRTPITISAFTHFALFLGRSIAWMLGRTPPDAIVTFPNSWCKSSSFLIANVKCRGTMRDFLFSRAAFPANSRISAHKYSSTPAINTGVFAFMRLVYLFWRRYRPIRPTGNWRPALLDDVVEALFLPRPPFPVPEGRNGKIC